MLDLIASVLASAALAAAVPAEQRQLFEVVSRVEVDAQGAIVAIEPPATMPPAINTAVQQNIRKLQFTPPKVDGRPVTGATWVRMQVCTDPEGKDKWIAMRFFGSGPFPIKSTAPVYPLSARIGGAGAKFDVELDLLPDGTLRVVKAKPMKPHGYQRDFLKSVQLWAQGQLYRTEEVAGEPVGDHFHTVLNFVMGPPYNPNQTDEVARKQAADARDAEAARIREGCDSIHAPVSFYTPGETSLPGKSASESRDARVFVRP